MVIGGDDNPSVFLPLLCHCNPFFPKFTVRFLVENLNPASVLYPLLF